MLGTTALCTAAVGCGDNRSDYEKAEEKIESDYQEARAAGMREAMADVDRQDREWEASQGPAPFGLPACKASVGILMSQNPKIMSGRTLEANKFAVSYRREDGTRWEYRCEVRSDRLRWALFEDGQEGRQRQEDDIRYRVKSGVLSITIRGIDGEDYPYEFSVPGLRKIKG